MTDLTDDETPDAALDRAARAALAGRPSAPNRTQFVRLLLPEVERCQALGWSAADFATVLSEHLPMTAKQFTSALRFARASPGPWGRRRQLAPASPPAPAPRRPAALGDWRNIDLGLGPPGEEPREERPRLNVIKPKKAKSE